MNTAAALVALAHAGMAPLARLAPIAAGAQLGAIRLGLLQPAEFLFLPPICLAIALVSSAAHRDNMRSILRHAFRSWLILMGGILAFMVCVSFFFEWVLPG